MDHMRISGIEPSSVILSQRKLLKKLKNNVPKVPKEAKAKRYGVINPQNYNFYQFEQKYKMTSAREGCASHSVYAS